MLVTSPYSAAVFVILLTVFVSPSTSLAQESLTREQILSNEEWLEFRQARYVGEPILVHLRTGQARAIIWPEPVELLDEEQILPGCAVEIDTSVVGFFPTRDFARTAIQFRGLETQIVYELRVRATVQGIEEPLQITR